MYIVWLGSKGYTCSASCTSPESGAANREPVSERLSSMDSLRLRRPPHMPWNSGRLRVPCLRFQFPVAPPASVHCALSKHGQRLVHSLTLAAGDATAADRMMRKFIAGSPKSVTLNALSHLMSPDTAHPNLSSLALPVILSKPQQFPRILGSMSHSAK